MRNDEIRQAAHSRRIPSLVHFTRVANIPTIFRYGIYPRGRIDQIGVTPAINDLYRFDGKITATSVSVAFPNHRMFFKYRNENPDVGWAVLHLAPSILWTKNCAFCPHNAADNRMSGAPEAALRGAAAFERMFEELDGVASREEQRLKPCDPTDVQAEVLVFDVIEQSLILRVDFDSQVHRNDCVPYLGATPACVWEPQKGFFAARSYLRLYHQ